MEQDGKVLDMFETYDGMKYRLVEVINSFGITLWIIRRNFMTLHINETLSMAQEKFYKIKDIFYQDQQVMKGGERHGRI